MSHVPPGPSPSSTRRYTSPLMARFLITWFSPESSAANRNQLRRQLPLMCHQGYRNLLRVLQQHMNIPDVAHLGCLAMPL
eukprot:4489049-Pyramimonas_sp.AAC.1